MRDIHTGYFDMLMGHKVHWTVIGKWLTILMNPDFVFNS